MSARIYQPAKTAMQSGQAKTHGWVLDYSPEIPGSVEPLMGYTASADMNRQIRLNFASAEEAISYCQRNGIAYELAAPHRKKPKTIAYSDNFRAGRPQPWTH